MSRLSHPSDSLADRYRTRHYLYADPDYPTPEQCAAIAARVERDRAGAGLDDRGLRRAIDREIAGHEVNRGRAPALDGVFLDEAIAFRRSPHRYHVKRTHFGAGETGEYFVGTRPEFEYQPADVPDGDWQHLQAVRAANCLHLRVAGTDGGTPVVSIKARPPMIEVLADALPNQGRLVARTEDSLKVRIPVPALVDEMEHTRGPDGHLLLDPHAVAPYLLEHLGRDARLLLARAAGSPRSRSPG